MRCLLINHSPVEGSGSGSYTQATAEHLTRLGASALVLTPASETGEWLKEGVIYRTLRLELGGVKAGAFPTFTGHPSSPLTYAELSVEQIKEYRRQLSEAVREAAREHRADIIHVQHLFLLAPLAGETGRAVVTTCHGSELHFCVAQNSPRWWKVLGDAVNSSDRIVTVSGYVAGLAEESCNIPRARQTVIHNGYNREIFSPTRPASSAARANSSERGAWLVVGAGRLVEYKRFDVLLQALKLLQCRVGPEAIRLRIVGDGPRRAELMRLAAELKLSDVSFEGFLTQQELAETFRAADATVIPSRNEPFGLVALESLACGTPVVASSTGGLPEFVDDSVGALVRGWEPQAWADAMLGELRKNSKRVKRAEMLRRASEHTWERATAELMKTYEAALEGTA